MSKKVEFNFNLHIPYVLSNYKIFDIGKDTNFNYFDEKKTGEIINLFSNMSYLEVNRILYNLIKINHNNFKFSLTISGVSIEIMKKYQPQLLESFKKLISTGNVEIKSGFYHSLNVPKVSKKEILEQVNEHKKIIEDTFNIKPTNFAKDFINFNEFPIDSSDFVEKIIEKNNEIIKLGFNYDFFGIKNNSESGVFEFLKYLPSNFLKNGFEFVIDSNNNEIHENNIIIKNQMQHNLITNISHLEELIKTSGNQEFIDNWKRISNFDYILDLDNEFFKSNSKNNFLSTDNHYELYIVIKNILEDMNLKLSRIQNNENLILAN